MSATRDYYEVLGVSRDADDADDQEGVPPARARAASRRQQHDPDAESKFKEAAEAYEVLSDPERRATYDRYGHEGLRSGGWAPNYECVRLGLRHLRGVLRRLERVRRTCSAPRAAGGAVQGGDVAVTAEISLSDAAHGTTAEVSYEAVAVCEHCRGNGAEPGTPIETCPRCEGTGQLRAVQRTPFGQVMRTAVCDTCHGDGKRPEGALQGVPRSRPQGRAPQGVDRHPSRDRRRPAGPRHRPRPRRRARRTRRRPVRARSASARTRASCATATTS